jgi:hypothetical protein
LSRPSLTHHRVWLAAALVLLAGGVTAQPAPDAPAAPPPAAETPTDAAAATEETPPAAVVTPLPEDKPAPPAEPMRRTRYDTAVLQVIDKVTAETLRFAAPVGRPVRYRGLVFTVRACERSAPDEPVIDSMAYLTVDAQPRSGAGMPALSVRQTFKGWMYAGSPGLNPLEHPLYDAWLISCRASAPGKVSAALKSP